MFHNFYLDKFISGPFETTWTCPPRKPQCWSIPVFFPVGLAQTWSLYTDRLLPTARSKESEGDLVHSRDICRYVRWWYEARNSACLSFGWALVEPTVCVCTIPRQLGKQRAVGGPCRSPSLDHSDLQKTQVRAARWRTIAQVMSPGNHFSHFPSLIWLDHPRSSIFDYVGLLSGCLGWLNIEKVSICDICMYVCPNAASESQLLMLSAIKSGIPADLLGDKRDSAPLNPPSPLYTCLGFAKTRL